MGFYGLEHNLGTIPIPDTRDITTDRLKRDVIELSYLALELAPRARPAMTLCVERHRDELWLIADDGRGNVKLLAKFENAAAAEIFTEANNARAAYAHAMGAMGI